MLVPNGDKYIVALSLGIFAVAMTACSSGGNTAAVNQNTGSSALSSTSGASSASSQFSVSSTSSSSSLSSSGTSSGLSSTSSVSSVASASSTSSASTAVTLGISGTPPTAVMVNSSYSFVPTTTGATGRTVAFSIQGKPGWATFNTLNGALTGVPASPGMYSGIGISVSDGVLTAKLNNFDVLVSATTGGTTLIWSVPVLNDDGTPLTDLTSYRIHYGTNSNNLASTINIPSPTTIDYSVSGLVSGTTYYFVITAVNSAGQESVLSNIATQAI